MQIGEQVDYRTRAKYVTGSGTTDIVFEYIVLPGDDSIRLGYDGESSIDFPTTTDGIYSIYDATVLADVTLPEVWSYNQLGEESAIQVYIYTSFCNVLVVYFSSYAMVAVLHRCNATAILSIAHLYDKLGVETQCGRDQPFVWQQQFHSDITGDRNLQHLQAGRCVP
jgi:hypothetical protein